MVRTVSADEGVDRDGHGDIAPAFDLGFRQIARGDGVNNDGQGSTASMDEAQPAQFLFQPRGNVATIEREGEVGA